MTTSVKKLKAEIEKLKNKLAGKEGEIDAMRLQIDTQRSHIVTASKLVDEKDATIEKLARSRNTLKQEADYQRELAGKYQDKFNYAQGALELAEKLLFNKGE